MDLTPSPSQTVQNLVADIIKEGVLTILIAISTLIHRTTSLFMIQTPSNLLQPTTICKKWDQLQLSRQSLLLKELQLDLVSTAARARVLNIMRYKYQQPGKDQ